MYNTLLHLRKVNSPNIGTKKIVFKVNCVIQIHLIVLEPHTQMNMNHTIYFEDNYVDNNSSTVEPPVVKLLNYYHSLTI